MPDIDSIKQHLIDIRDPTGPSPSWDEGYISAACDFGFITENELEELIQWLKQTYQLVNQKGLAS